MQVQAAVPGKCLFFIQGEQTIICAGQQTTFTMFFGAAPCILFLRD